MDNNLDFLRRRGLTLELYMNGDQAPAWELVQKHVEAVRAFVADIRLHFTMQTIYRCGPQLTADDVAKAANMLLEAQHELDLLRWRRQHGRFADEIEQGLPLARRTDAHLAAFQARPAEPQYNATASDLPLPSITYEHGSAVLEYLGAAEVRKGVAARA